MMEIITIFKKERYYVLTPLNVAQLQLLSHVVTPLMWPSYSCPRMH